MKFVMDGKGEKVFVTVGSTSFDSLIKSVCSANVLSILESLGFTKLILQIGKSVIEPSQNNHGNLNIGYYNYKSSISEDIAGSSLIISHAGAGSIMEALESGKPLVVVVNENLMNNHQVELANQLETDRYVFCCVPNTLAETLEQFDSRKLRPYLPSEPQMFSSFLDQVMGFT